MTKVMQFFDRAKDSNVILSSAKLMPATLATFARAVGNICPCRVTRFGWFFVCNPKVAVHVGKVILYVMT